MIFLLPVFAAKAAVATITIGEALGISAAVLGIGAGIKGSVDYQRAKKLKAEAEAEYQEMAQRIRRRTARLKIGLKVNIT
jgi:hypothetical protein